MSVVDIIIKVLQVVYRLALNYRVNHTPGSTEKERSIKEKTLDDIRKIEKAVVEGDTDYINIMFKQLCTDVGVLGVSTDTGGTGERTGGDPIRHGDTPSGQRVLQSESGVVVGSIQAEPNPAYAPTGVPRRAETNRVIFHHSASVFGDVEIINSWHKERGFSCIGYHYVVPKKGHFEHGRKLQLIGAHARGRNGDSVGVCIVGHLGQKGMTDSQEQQCLRLYHDLCRAYSKKLEIEFHHEECPGKFLDRELFTKMLESVI